MDVLDVLAGMREKRAESGECEFLVREPVGSGSFLESCVFVPAAETPALCVQNVVSTFRLRLRLSDGTLEKTRIPLSVLAQRSCFMQYNPTNFAAVIVRAHDRAENNATTALIFSGCNCVCTGARSPLLARKAIGQHCGLVSSALGKPFEVVQIVTQNIVCSASVGHTVDLQRIREDPRFRIDTFYDGDLFPGLICRPKDFPFNIVVLVYLSGNCVVTGASSVEHARYAWERVFKRMILPYVVLDGPLTQMSSSEYRAFTRNRLDSTSALASLQSIALENLFPAGETRDRAARAAGLDWNVLDDARARRECSRRRQDGR